MRLAHAKKRDLNEREIIEIIEPLGISVIQSDDFDLICGYKGQNYLFEVKSLDEVSRKTGQPYPRCIQPSQRDLLNTWNGQYRIVWKAEQILDALNVNVRF